MRTIDDIFMGFLAEAEDDYVGLWAIAAATRWHLGMSDNDKVKAITLAFVRDFLEHSLCAGDYAYSDAMFHPWAERDVIDLNEICEADFILPEESNDLYSLIHDRLADAGVSILQLRTLVSLGSLEAIAMSVQEGLGVGFVPEIMVHRLVKGRVKPIEIAGFDISQGVFIGRNLHRPTTAAQEAFWDMVLMSNEVIGSANQST